MQERHVQGTTVFSFLRSLIPLLFVSFASLGLLSAGTAWAAAPAAPTNLTATMASSRQINLAWTDNATTETNYYVERSPNGSSSWTVVATLGANITSYQNTGLTLSTIYYYRVRCQAGSTYSSYSNTANATTATLAAPTSLTASVASSTQIALAWADNTTYETQYSIERSPNGSSSWTVLGTVATNVTTTTNSGLTVGTAYYYRVRAYDSTNYSAYSNTANQTIRTITASAGANGAIAPSGTVGVANASNKSFTMTPNSGYKIATVTVDGSSVATNPTYTFSNVTANHTINATFSANTVTITASAGANGTINPSGAVAVPFGASQPFTITPNPSYHISDVSVDLVSVGTPSLYTFPSVTTAHSIAASFAINTFTINATAGANGSISPSGADIVTSGTTPTFTATPNAGYRILDVQVDGASVGSSPTYTFAPVTANHTIAATFTVQTYTITATAGANGAISPSGSVVVSSGTSTSFTITPNANYHISDVSVDGASVGTPSLYTFPSVTSTHSILASFAVNTFTISAGAGDNGSISPSGAVIVSSGSTPTFTATPNAGYHILDVQVDGSSVGSALTYTFAPVTANHTISALFSVNSYTISAGAGANGTISPSGAVLVSAGSSTTFTFLPNAGYRVSDVLVDNASVGAPPSYTFPNVAATHSILASFSVNTYTITAAANANGAIDPFGPTVVNYGDSQTFTITPNAGYHVSDVLVDGSSAGAVTLYTFPTVTTSHSITASFASDNLVLSGVMASANTLDTSVPGSVSIFFTINSAATVTFNIIPEKQGPPVYQTGKVCSAGACLFTWDGKDNTGRVVPDEAYLFVLAASDGTRSDTYSPPAPTGTGTVTCSQSTGLDPAKNIPLTVVYTPAQPSRVNVAIDWGNQNFKILDAFPVISGNHTFIWDGRNPSNKLLDVGAQSSCSVASLLGENCVITTGDAVQISEIKTDPYMMHLSYGQFTRIKYTLSRDANVTLMLTSPSGAVITLFNNQAQIAGAQEADWNGLDPADTTEKNMLVTEEGDYMVSVQAVNPITGASSTARANVRIGY